jgi:hypothetical protein
MGKNRKIQQNSGEISFNSVNNETHKIKINFIQRYKEQEVKTFTINYSNLQGIFVTFIYREYSDDEVTEVNNVKPQERINVKTRPK